MKLSIQRRFCEQQIDIAKWTCAGRFVGTITLATEHGMLRARYPSGLHLLDFALAWPVTGNGAQQNGTVVVTC